MPRLIINGKSVEVSLGATILDAAQKLGIVIPTLCHLQGEKPFTSCMICVVKDCVTGRLLPSCSAPAAEGMIIETESDEVLDERRKILDLLLGEHVGDCEGPCTTTCPARMNIPLMIRQIASGQMTEAYETVTDMIALPAVLGRICPAPCEKACRRGKHDKPISICLLKRFVADVGLARNESRATVTATGKKVAIIGVGPAGLSAAFYLARAGHACTVFDEHDEPGGQLRYKISRDKLTAAVLDQEIDTIRRLGVEFRMKTRIEPGDGLKHLKTVYDAIVLAPGRLSDDQRLAWSLDSDERGVKVEVATYRTSDPAVFAGGGVVQAGQMAVRAVAHGKSMACAIGQWLSGNPVVGVKKPFESRIGQLQGGEINEIMKEADPGSRIAPRGGVMTGYSAEEAVRESQRCLQCDCRKAKGCKLRELADEYHSSQKTFTVGYRNPFTRIIALPAAGMSSQVVYEPGKCIKCGICVRITERRRVGAGLAFLGRGFETVVGVPFGDSLVSALGSSAAECVRECPTGALAWKDGLPEEDARNLSGMLYEHGRRPVSLDAMQQAIRQRGARSHDR